MSKEFDETGRMLPSSYYDRIVDVAAEPVRFTVLTRGHADQLVDRYSERTDRQEPTVAPAQLANLPWVWLTATSLPGGRLEEPNISIASLPLHSGGGSNTQLAFQHLQQNKDKQYRPGYTDTLPPSEGTEGQQRAHRRRELRECEKNQNDANDRCKRDIRPHHRAEKRG